MNARRLNISIRTGQERTEALRRAFQRVARGDLSPQASQLYFEGVGELRHVLTEKRLELLVAITRHHPPSVHALAGLMGRDYKNVSTDIAVLERLGLVRLDARGAGSARVPTVPYDEIRVTIDLRQTARPHAA